MKSEHRAASSTSLSSPDEHTGKSLAPTSLRGMGFAAGQSAIQPGPACRVAQPGLTTRVELVRELLGFAGTYITSPELVMALAMARGWLSASNDLRPHDPVNRAEAAAILTRYAGVSQAKLANHVLYFHDVAQGDWYFQAAHAARLYGIFRGDQQNRFLPGGTLDPTTTAMLVARARSPRPQSKEQQRAGLLVEPLHEPSALTSLMAKDRLAPDELQRARELIARQPTEQQGDLYEALQSKVVYNNQRDSQSSAEQRDGGLCNLASLSMCLSYLGVSNPYPDMEYEDALEKIRADHGYADRTYASGWGAVARHLGVQTGMIAGNAKSKEFWTDTIRNDYLRKGQAVMLSITGHIVRVQGVSETGVVVDDPYGQSTLHAGAGYSFAAYNGGSHAGGLRPADPTAANNRAGEDHTWPWKQVLAHSMNWIAWFSR